MILLPKFFLTEKLGPLLRNFFSVKKPKKIRARGPSCPNFFLQKKNLGKSGPLAPLAPFFLLTEKLRPLLWNFL